MDRGNVAADKFRLSSADESAAYRFYRLKRTATWSNAPITVTITNITIGATVSNIVTVRGSSSATQGIASLKLLVDGFSVGRVGGGNFSLDFDTRYFGNGSHRLTAQATDAGALESPEEVNPVAWRGAAYASTNVSVNFNNFISAARLKYEAFRPDLGQTQEVFALWASPRLWRVDMNPEGRCEHSFSVVFRRRQTSGGAVGRQELYQCTAEPSTGGLQHL